MSQFNHVVLHLLIYGDVGVEVDVDDYIDAGVISHVILPAAQAADRRVRHRSTSQDYLKVVWKASVLRDLCQYNS